MDTQSKRCRKPRSFRGADGSSMHITIPGKQGIPLSKALLLLLKLLIQKSLGTHGNLFI